MRFYFYLLLLFLLSLSTSVAIAQNTFIKRYKNTALPEGSVAVCNLPDNRIAIIGQQSNGFAWQSPMVVITDSAGKQLRHFVDTSCYACDIYDGTTDSEGFVYVIGKFYGKAGIAKYDTSGNKLWQKQLSTNGGESGFNTLTISRDGLLVAGGFQIHYPMVVGWTLIVAYNTNGDTLWTIDSNHGYTWQDTRFDILGITVDSSYIYATGYVSDTLPKRVIFIRISKAGQVLAFKELNNGRKWGYGIILLTPDSILIGGRGDIVFSNYYSFLSLVDSMGNVLHTAEDSNYLFNLIMKMDYDDETQTLYVLDYDTLYDSQLGHKSYYHVATYQLPVTSLQQPLWEKTVTGTSVTGTYTGLRKATDGTLLHTGPAATNCPHCPYLLKADANTCADIVACDTAFFSGISIPESLNAVAKLYPNPVSEGFVFIELQSDVPLESVEVSCFNLSGRLLHIEADGHILSSNFYQVRINADSRLANGVYLVKLKVNGTHYVNTRFIKAGYRQD